MWSGFWVFTLVFFCYAGAIQSLTDRYPLGNATYTSMLEAQAVHVILLGSAAFALPYVVTARTRVRVGSWATRSRGGPDMRVVAGMAVVSALAAAAFVPVAEFASFFNSRDAVTGILFDDGGSSLRLYELESRAVGVLRARSIRVPAMLALVGLCWIVARPRLRSHWRRVLGPPLFYVIMVGVGAINVVVNNPVSNARSWWLFVVTAAASTIPGVFSARRWSLLVVVWLVVLASAFSTFDAFRRGSGPDLTLAGPVEAYTQDGTYSAYQLTVESLLWVQENGHTYGRQAIGAAAFFVPRGIWSEKPGDTGNLAGGRVGGNVAASLWSEGYVDLGYLGVVLWLAAWGVLSAKLDRLYAFSSVDGLARAIVPPIAVGSIFILRGSLQTSLGGLAPAVLALLILLSGRGVRVRALARGAGAGS
jgi:hypothetical protein